MKKILTYSTLVIISSLLFACNETNGSWGELIIASPNKSKVERYATGSAIQVAAKSLGSDMISQYKVQLQLSKNSIQIDTSAFEEAFSSTFLYISSPNQSFPSINYDLVVPIDFLPGQYHLLVSGIVNSNSEAKDTVSIVIYNEIDTVSPSIVIISPESNFVIGKSDSLTLGVYTSDLMAYDKQGILYQVSVDIIQVSTGVQTNIFKKTKLKQHELEINQVVKLPSGLAGGNYKLQVTSVDRYNNVATKSIPFKVE